MMRIELKSEPHPCGVLRWCYVRHDGHVVGVANSLNSERSDDDLVAGAIGAYREMRGRLRESLRRFQHAPRLWWYETAARRRARQSGWEVDPR